MFKIEVHVKLSGSHLEWKAYSASHPVIEEDNWATFLREDLFAHHDYKSEKHFTIDLLLNY